MDISTAAAKPTMYQIDLCSISNHYDDRIDFSCRICNMKFAKKERLKNHLITYHGGDGILDFMLKERLSIRMKEAQRNKMMIDLRQNYDADTTEKLITEYDTAEAEINLEVENKTTCDHCGDELLTQDELNVHISTMHKSSSDLPLAVFEESQKYFQVAGSTLIECSICKKQTKNVSGMKTHITRLHKGQPLEEAVGPLVNTNENGQIRDYVLKVKDSVEKKLKCANLDPVKVLTVRTNGKEKVNNETMTLQLNLGLFEYLIRHLGEELAKRKNVELKADAKPPPKALTDLFGDAIVECQGDAKFTVEGKELGVKITMYNTGTCTMNLQSGGQKPEELGGVTIAEYFAYRVVAPMIKDIHDENPALNDIAQEKLKILRNQISQYEMTSKPHHQNKNIPAKAVSSEVTSANKTLIQESLKCNICQANVKTDSFGQCYKCNAVEHLNCTAGAKKNADEYKSGKKKYTCEACCFKSDNQIIMTPTMLTSTEDPTHGEPDSMNPEEEVPTITLEETIETDSHVIVNDIVNDLVIDEVFDNENRVSETSMILEKYRHLHAENEMLKINLEGMKVDVDYHKSESLRLETERNEIKHENASLKEKLIEAIASATNTRRESEEIQSDLKKQIQDLEFDHERLKSVARKRLEELKQNVCDSNVEVVRHENKITELVKEREAISNENKTHKLLYDELKEKIKRLEDTNLEPKSDTINDERDAHAETVDGNCEEDESEKEDSEISLEQLLGFVEKRGFKRTSPTTRPITTSPQAGSVTSTVNGKKTTVNDNDKKNQEESQLSSKRYCHFYNNRGGCKPPSGRQCQWVHEMAPQCNSDKNNQCTRMFCMFSHINKKFLQLNENQGFRTARLHRPGEPKQHPGQTPVWSGHQPARAALPPVQVWSPFRYPPPPVINTSDFPPLIHPWQNNNLNQQRQQQQQQQSQQGWWVR